MNKLELLPDDMKIYNDCDQLSPRIKFEAMMKLVNSIKCQQLDNYKELSVFIKDMLTVDSDFLNYALHHGHENHFNTVYNEAMVNKKKHFTQFTCLYESFALAWLFYLYH